MLTNFFPSLRKHTLILFLSTRTGPSQSESGFNQMKAIQGFKADPRSHIFPSPTYVSGDNATSYFGTSPEPWNYLLKGMTLLPDSIMGDRDLMQALAEFSEPLVRITDKLVRLHNYLHKDLYGLYPYVHALIFVCIHFHGYQSPRLLREYVWRFLDLFDVWFPSCNPPQASMLAPPPSMSSLCSACASQQHGSPR